MSLFAQSLYKFPALMMTCPPLYFVECDFLEKLPFLTKRYSNLVMESARQIELSRRVISSAAERNHLIDLARSATMPMGVITQPQLDTIIQTQASLSVAECVACLELLETFQRTAKSIELIIKSYNIRGEHMKLIMPPAIEEIMPRLRAIRENAMSQMPGPDG